MNDFVAFWGASHPAMADAADLQRASRLARMQRTATCLLACMLALLVVSAVWQSAHPWLSWLRAFAEAGAVGATADWYAVVSLFRRPFGLPIPHTSIVVRNQHRIAEGLGSFVETNFLKPELITERLSRFNATQALARWLVDLDNRCTIVEVVSESLPGLLAEINETDIEHCFERVVRPQLGSLDLPRIAGSVVSAILERGQHQLLLDHGLRALENWLAANVGTISAKFSEASRFTPARFDAYVVRKFVNGIISLLHEVAAAPEHELRRQFDDAARRLAAELPASPALRRASRSLLRDYLRRFSNEVTYRAFLDHLREQVSADISHETSIIRGAVDGLVRTLGGTLDKDVSLQRKLNAWWLTLTRELTLRYRHQLTLLIVDVVKTWDAELVSRKIEAEIGRDLQYIRINGTFVGGIVGVLLHASMLAFPG